MKLFMEPIDVSVRRTDPNVQYQADTSLPAHTQQARILDNTPVAFCWRGQLYEVENVLERWLARGEWWGTEEQREYYMLLTQRGVMEVFNGREGWVLSRIVD